MNVNISSALGGSRAGISVRLTVQEAEIQLSDFGTAPCLPPQQLASWALQPSLLPREDRPLTKGSGNMTSQLVLPSWSPFYAVWHYEMQTECCGREIFA